MAPMTALTPLADRSNGYLTTVGRRSGRAHTIEIWFALQGETVYLLSGSGGRSDWCRNVARTPEVTFSIDGVEVPGRARAVVDQVEDALARDIIVAKYQPRYRGDLAGWRRESRPYAIDLSG
jgi:deazaflavin-dependent oxidoreductase (nitroreductase family)